MASERTVVLRDYYRPTERGRFAVLRDYDEPRPRPRSATYRILARVVGANSRAYDQVKGVPDQLEQDWLAMRDKQERRLLLKSMVHADLLTEPRRKVLLSILFWTMILLWAGVGTIVAVLARDSFAAYQAGWTLFFYSIATSLFLPTPFEVLLGSARDQLGLLWTVLIAAFAKTVGAWLVLMAGDKANAGLERLAQRGGMLARLFRGLERFAQKYGLPLIFFTFAIPFMSDTAPLFIGAALKMNKGMFLLVTFAAIVIRSILFLVAGDVVASLF